MAGELNTFQKAFKRYAGLSQAHQGFIQHNANSPSLEALAKDIDDEAGFAPGNEARAGRRDLIFQKNSAAENDSFFRASLSGKIERLEKMLYPAVTRDQAGNPIGLDYADYKLPGILNEMAGGQLEKAMDSFGNVRKLTGRFKDVSEKHEEYVDACIFSENADGESLHAYGKAELLKGGKDRTPAYQAVLRMISLNTEYVMRFGRNLLEHKKAKLRTEIIDSFKDANGNVSHNVIKEYILEQTDTHNPAVEGAKFDTGKFYKAAA